MLAGRFVAQLHNVALIGRAHPERRRIGQGQDLILQPCRSAGQCLVTSLITPIEGQAAIHKEGLALVLDGQRVQLLDVAPRCPIHHALNAVIHRILGAARNGADREHLSIGLMLGPAHHFLLAQISQGEEAAILGDDVHGVVGHLLEGHVHHRAARLAE